MAVTAGVTAARRHGGEALSPSKMLKCERYVETRSSAEDEYTRSSDSSERGMKSIVQVQRRSALQ